MEFQVARELSSRKTHAEYADSFEDFIAMINETSDAAEVRQIRYNILTEIMQATTMENLRQAKGALPTSGPPGAASSTGNARFEDGKTGEFVSVCI